MLSIIKAHLERLSLCFTNLLPFLMHPIKLPSQSIPCIRDHFILLQLSHTKHLKVKDWNNSPINVIEARNIAINEFTCLYLILITVL